MGGLEGLEEGVIPVEPMQQSLVIKMPIGGGKTTQRTVHRRQFPITPANAFTDYRAQGQTIGHVIVDIGKPPQGSLSLFNLYVALSRSSGQKTIRLLRDFDDKMLKQVHDFDLIEEDSRLERLDRQTETWWRKMEGGMTVA